MKKILSGVMGAAIAVSSVAVTKAIPGIDPPACPEGTFMYYFIPIYTPPNIDINELRDKTKWMKAQEDEQFECSGTEAVCAICAFPDNQLQGKPELDPNEQSINIQTHTQVLLGKFVTYDASNNILADDSVDELFFEHNLP